MAEGKKVNFYKVNPIKRSDKFFGGNDINLEIKLGREYLTDINHEVLLFKVDYKKTKVHDLYGESKSHEKVVAPPIKLQCRVTISEGETKYLANIGIKKEYAGDLTFTVYDVELEEKKVDISMGDYIGYVDGHGKLRYWEVVKNDKINIDNSKTINGIVSYYKKVVCIPVDSDQFKG